VQDSALAEDVTQETIIKAWRNLDSYRGDASLRRWVLRIAHNTAVSTLRRIRDTAIDPTELPERSVGITTERRVEGFAGVEALSDALAELDDLTRSSVVVREVEGLSYSEIAELLEVPMPTVKTRLLRARRTLSVALTGWEASS